MWGTSIQISTLQHGFGVDDRDVRCLKFCSKCYCTLQTKFARLLFGALDIIRFMGTALREYMFRRATYISISDIEIFLSNRLYRNYRFVFLCALELIYMMLLMTRRTLIRLQIIMWKLIAVLALLVSYHQLSEQINLLYIYEKEILSI